MLFTIKKLIVGILIVFVAVFIGTQFTTPKNVPPADLKNGIKVDQETRMNLLHNLSGPFIIYRSNIQGELHLTENQIQLLEEALPEYIDATVTLYSQFDKKNVSAREKAMVPHREKYGDKLWVFLEKTLDAEQLSRFKQLELQHEGPAALFRPQVENILKITQEQKKQVMDVIQKLQTDLEILVKEAELNGNREILLSKAIAIRDSYDIELENLLNEEQKKLWLEMRGPSFNVWQE